MTSSSNAAVAALVATANRPELLGRALRSIEGQTLSPAYIYVVDDSDSDDFKAQTEDIVRQHGNVKFLRNSRAKGAAGAWNDGLDHLLRTPDSAQLYVAILDDDDEWEPEHLQTCLETAASGRFDIVAAQLWRHEDDAEPKLCMPPESLDAADFLVGNPNIQGSNLFCRLSVMLEAGLFDEWLPSCTDRDLCIRIADLPGVLYGTTKRTTVRHYASGSLPRLSTPGQQAKNDGLTRFFAKYQGRMSADQRAAFKERAARLFGWHEAEPSERQQLPAAPTSTPIDSSDTSPTSAPGTLPHVVLGVIADTTALADLKRLLGDLRNLAAQPELAGFDAVVLENSHVKNPNSELRDLAEGERKRGLHIHLVDRARHVEDARCGRVHDGGASEGGYLRIAPARTVLQSYLYAFAKRRPGAIVWIVDDDLRLDPLVASADGHFQRRPQPLLRAFRKLQALRDSGDADVVIGRCTGAPPLPFAATVRTQMVDLVASLIWLAAQSPSAALPDRATENALLRHGRRDYYYDLSRKETDRLETPFWVTPGYDGQTVGEAFKHLASRAERMLAGEQLFRPLVVEANDADPLALGKGLQRGGNTFVLDIETLRLAPNPAPAINGRPTRRSDMIWALLQERHLERKVVTMPLALHQDRSRVAVGKLDVDRILDDMRGYALFSALDAVSEVFSSDGVEGIQLAAEPEIDRFLSRVRKFMNERLAAFRLSFYRVRGLARVLRQLVESDAAWWHDEPYEPARVSLRSFCDRLDRSYATSVLACIERGVAQLNRAQLRTFLAELPDQLEDHRARLADVTELANSFNEDRIANAKAVAGRLTNPVGPLNALGYGGEGVALTDGEHVYKVFDYWKSWQRNATLVYLRTLVGAWRDTHSLYPLLALREQGHDALLIYPFEPSKPYTGGYGPGLVGLLAECGQFRVACRNLHPDNLRVVGDRVRLIDYGSDIRPLEDDQEFTTMCQRAWLSLRCHDRADLKAIMRHALQDANLPELEGFEAFHDAVLRFTGERKTRQDIALELCDEPKRVLDYGCGNGTLAEALASRGAQVLGYDPDPTRAKRWRERRNGASDLRFTTARDEVFNSAPFDLVVCQRVLCTVDDAEMRRILRHLRAAVADDGRVVVTLCDPRYTLGGPTPEADRELPAGARYEDTFVWLKTVRTSGRKRREVHRPEDALLAEFASVGLRETRRTTVPTVNLMDFMPASDHLAFELVVDKEARP